MKVKNLEVGLVIILCIALGFAFGSWAVEKTKVMEVIPPDCVPIATPTPNCPPGYLLATPTVVSTATPTIGVTPGLPAWGIPSSLPITVGAAKASPYFRILATGYEDGDHSGGRHNVYVRVEHEDGSLMYGANICLGWPGGMDCSAVTQDRSGDAMYPRGYMADYPLYGGSWNPANGAGAYSVWIMNAQYGSEVLQGLGLPFNQHVNYYVTYRLVK